MAGVEKAPAPPGDPYVRYGPDVESAEDDEEQSIADVVNALRKNNERAYRRYKHAIRDAHAKSHGALVGELCVYSNLAPHLRQGMFARPGAFPVVVRLSSIHGALRSDKVRGKRAMAIKVFGVEGRRALEKDQSTNQDFLLSNNDTFFFKDARAYKEKMFVARLYAGVPDILLMGLSRIAPVVEPASRCLPRNIHQFIEGLARPNTDLLGETYHSASAYRFGDYVARFSVAPFSPAVRKLTGRRLSKDAGDNAFRERVAAFFLRHGADFELRAQLCTDLTSMPVEDVTKSWPESDSPHQPIARLRFSRQEACSPARLAYVDDTLSFSPWNGLDDHRPLGSINRLKRKSYESSSQFRHEKNGSPLVEPRSIGEVPT